MGGFTYVRQRGRDDCGVAAMAMFMGRDYEQTLALIQELNPAYVPGQPTSLPLLLGVLGTYDEFPVATFYRAAAAPALLCVYSPEDERMGHAVFWDGSRLWDPSPGTPVTQEWLEGRVYLQIQRVRDLTEIMPSKAAGAVRQALGDPHGDIVAPGEARRDG